LYYIARLAQTFSPSDTIPHYVDTIKGEKLYKSINENLNLIIKFNEKYEPLVVAEELNKLKFVKAAEVNAKPTFYMEPQDHWWEGEGGIN
jgi:hypothetical protein